MDWKQGLDKYLTTPPEDDFNNWCELVWDNGDEDVPYQKYEEHITTFNRWENKLYSKGYDTIPAYLVLCRAYRRFLK